MVVRQQLEIAEDKHVADATTFRLDTADIAIEAGWQLESMSRIDEFSKDGVTVMVQYAADDEIESLTRSREGRADDVCGADSPGKAERLRIWLGVRAAAGPKTSVNGLPSIPYKQDRPSGCWTLESFAEAVDDPQDRAFLIRFLELVAANSVLPRKGSYPPLYFGMQPGGWMFVYPFGRRHPPFKFSIRQGQLMISGCWTKFPKVLGHPGFAPLASMLDLDEKGPASDVSIAGLDPDEVWEVGEMVSQAIN
jgi:hypothetical protein